MIAAFFWVQSDPKKVLQGYLDWILGIFSPVTHFVQRLFQIIFLLFFYCCGSGRRRQILARREQEFRRKVRTLPDLEDGQRYYEGGLFDMEDDESVNEAI
jgi:hypothetical protein